MANLELTRVTAAGQIQEGELLLIRMKNGELVPVEAKQVLRPGKEGDNGEEIVISIARNNYFIMRLYLEGKSWVVDCYRIPNGRVYAVTNNMRDISRAT